MTAKEFLNKVAKMRSTQKEYEKLKDSLNYNRKIKLEAEVDAVVDRLADKINNPTQQTLM